MVDYVPGLAGVPATKSKISSLDGEKGILAYRGYTIADLAENSTFEEVSYLLLNGNLPNPDQLANFESHLKANRRVKYNVRKIMRDLPASGHPMEMLQTAVASMGMFYAGDECLTGGDLCEDIHYVQNMSVKILSRMSTLVAMWENIRNGYDSIQPRDDLSHAGNLLYMLNGKEPDEYLTRIMDACLILHAEHTINASTFAALVTSSTLASPYLVMAAAIGTLAGPLHGGANQRVVEMLKEIDGPKNAKAWIDKKMSEKGVIWGMGHREYKVKDPRATYLQTMMEDWVKTRGKLSKMFETALEVERICEERLASKGVFPNVDFYSGILYTEMGIPADQFTPLFAVSRSAGWLAHWKEQLTDNRIYRPTQIYTGEDIRPYTSINKR